MTVLILKSIRHGLRHIIVYHHCIPWYVLKRLKRLAGKGHVEEFFLLLLHFPYSNPLTFGVNLGAVTQCQLAQISTNARQGLYAHIINKLATIQSEMGQQLSILFNQSGNVINIIYLFITSHRGFMEPPQIYNSSL